MRSKLEPGSVDFDVAAMACCAQVKRIAGDVDRDLKASGRV